MGSHANFTRSIGLTFYECNTLFLCISLLPLEVNISLNQDFKQITESSYLLPSTAIYMGAIFLSTPLFIFVLVYVSYVSGLESSCIGFRIIMNLLSFNIHYLMFSRTSLGKTYTTPIIPKVQEWAILCNLVAYRKDHDSSFLSTKGAAPFLECTERGHHPS